MQLLKFSVRENMLIRHDQNTLIQYSRNDAVAEFIFSDEWKDIDPLVVQFRKSDNCCYDVFIEDGKAPIPWEVLQESGTLEVTVMGGDLHITNTVKVIVYESGLVGGLVPTKASPGVYGYLVDEINGIKELELIARYEVTEETAGGKAINISLDNNGNAFELKDAVLVVNTVAASSGMIYADGRINNVYVSNLVKGLANKSITVVSAKMNKLCNKYLCDYEVCKLNTDRYATSGTRQVGKMIFTDSIKSVGITSNVTFDAGTVIELYGRRY